MSIEKKITSFFKTLTSPPHILYIGKHRLARTRFDDIVPCKVVYAEGGMDNGFQLLTKRLFYETVPH